MTFSRTENLDLIRFMLTDPKAYRRMANDSAPAPEDLPVRTIPGIDYILAEAENVPLALFLVDYRKTGPGIAEVHFCYSPDVWGRALFVAIGFVEWVWANTSFHSLIGEIPSYNPLARALAVAVGFRDAGLAEKTVRKNGMEYRVSVLHLERPPQEVAA